MKKQKSTILLLGLLSAATLLTGCGKNTNMTTIHRPTPPFQGDTHTQGIPLTLATPADNNNQPIETVVEDFLNQELSGNVQSINLIFHNNTLDIIVSDDLTTTTNQVLIIEDLQRQNESTAQRMIYSDNYGSIYLDIPDGQQTHFVVSFENYDDTGNIISSGILGSVFICQVQATC